jgi:hypothetical protein
MDVEALLAAMSPEQRHTLMMQMQRHRMGGFSPSAMVPATPAVNLAEGNKL